MTVAESNVEDQLKRNDGARAGVLRKSGESRFFRVWKYEEGVSRLKKS